MYFLTEGVSLTESIRLFPVVQTDTDALPDNRDPPSPSYDDETIFDFMDRVNAATKCYFS